MCDAENGECVYGINMFVHKQKKKRKRLNEMNGLTQQCGFISLAAVPRIRRAELSRLTRETSERPRERERQTRRKSRSAQLMPYQLGAM